ncbi:Fe-S cluster assembly protein SufD [bacterium]|nr:MAG: Fe-S cluster assembly protein SufD [bacterium]
MAAITNNKEWYQKQFRSFEESLNGQKSLPIHDFRKLAFDQFMALDFPNSKNEDWKYTNIEPILNSAFESSSGNDVSKITSEVIEPFLIADMAVQLIFVDGQFSQALSKTGVIPKGITITRLSDALSAHADKIQTRIQDRLKTNKNIFTALNSAFIMNGVYIEIGDHAALEKPIYILHLSASDNKPYLNQPYHLITTGKNSQVSIVENSASLVDGSVFTNSFTDIAVGADARVEYVKIQQESTKTFHIGSTEIHQDRNSRFTHRLITSGGALVRNVIQVHLDDEGIESTLDGVYLAHGTQHVDNRTIIHHAKPNCNSHELYKGILDGKSSGVFNGKIIVHPDAQKTDAKQSNKNILLSQDAVMNTKPQLEIFADDVKCTHGATIGRLEEESLFYLRSRGIGKEQAKNMLTYAFAGEIVSRIGHEPTRTYLDGLLLDRLEH